MGLSQEPANNKPGSSQENGQPVGFNMNSVNLSARPALAGTEIAASYGSIFTSLRECSDHFKKLNSLDQLHVPRQDKEMENIQNVAYKTRSASLLYAAIELGSSVLFEFEAPFFAYAILSSYISHIVAGYSGGAQDSGTINPVYNRSNNNLRKCQADFDRLFNDSLGLIDRSSCRSGAAESMHEYFKVACLNLLPRTIDQESVDLVCCKVRNALLLFDLKLAKDPITLANDYFSAACLKEALVIIDFVSSGFLSASSFAESQADEKIDMAKQFTALFNKIKVSPLDAPELARFIENAEYQVEFFH